jgi:hypothetical protein
MASGLVEASAEAREPLPRPPIVVGRKIGETAMTAHTYSAIPAIQLETTKAEAHPLRPVFVTVLTLKIAVAAFLLGTVSLAPPVSAETSYMSVAAVE